MLIRDSINKISIASIVHTQMLIKQKIISGNDGKKIIKGLNKIKSQIEKGQF